MISRRTFFATVAVAFTASLFTGCATIKFTPPNDGIEVSLDIPDRAWAPDRPDKSVGWCGEACIQMVLEFYGVETTQSEIYAAANPLHADLYSNDINPAMDALGVSYVVWDSSIKDMSQFIGWIRGHLSEGRPVICGIKIYPDQHPFWSLDHFVVAVGFNETGLILNTQLDLDGQIQVSYEQLASKTPGYSFKSNRRWYFARAVTGVEDR